jgi:hypothetical protein
MNRGAFNKLCHSFIDKVGVGVFKSKGRLLSHELRSTNEATRCATNALGGTPPGEMKLGIMLLRLLAGASYIDVLLTYGISTSSVYSVFHEATS